MYKIHLFLIFLGFINFACGSDSQKSNSKYSTGSSNLPDSPNYGGLTFLRYLPVLSSPDAIVEMYSPVDNQAFDEGKILFQFNVKNFPQLLQENQKPYLFMAINEGNPSGLKSTSFEKKMDVGTFRLVIFLVDENEFVLKDFGNYIARDFRVGDSRLFSYGGEPYLLVNHPREGLEMDMMSQMKLDFLVLGGDMSLDDLKLLVLINDVLVLETNKMEAFHVSNLPKGNHEIKILLQRGDGKNLKGRFSKVIRSVIVR